MSSPLTSKPLHIAGSLLPLLPSAARGFEPGEVSRGAVVLIFHLAMVVETACALLQRACLLNPARVYTPERDDSAMSVFSVVGPPFRTGSRGLTAELYTLEL